MKKRLVQVLASSALAALGTLFLACSGRAPADPGASQAMGVLVAKPGGGYFLADPHHGGGASRVHLVEATWGRRVEVHDVDEHGVASPLPVLRDVVIGEGVLTNGTEFVLETNPVTHAQRLIVLRPREDPGGGTGTFDSVLARAIAGQSPVLPKNDDGSAHLPVSFAARNAVLALRFDDLLEDGPEARESLRQAVRLRSGYPPIAPQEARVVFDPSHGGIAGGAFHSTRVLIDFTISEEEALELPEPLPINAAGLPASSPLSAQPNASVHLPTRLDPAAGRFVRLTNLDGHGLAVEGPIEAATGDLVRSFRSGNAEDLNSGFLLDTASPSVIGSWDIAVEGARDDPEGPAGFGFELDLVFRTPCRAAPSRGDTLEIGGETYEVRAPGTSPDADGRVRNLRLLRSSGIALQQPAVLLGLARFLLPYRPEIPVDAACWLSFSPPPLQPPSDGVSTDARVSLRFSEPMDPSTFRAFDTLRVLRGAEDGGEAPRAQDLVVGAIRVEGNLQRFSFVPRLPLSNTLSPNYRVELLGSLEGVTDLSGSALTGTFERAGFALAEGQVPRTNGGVALRFQDRDELDPRGPFDLRGQITYEFGRGILHPRTTLFASYPADRTQPVPSLMVPFALGVQTPLSPFGSKLQMLWRYCDFGFSVRDESRYNLDVIGLYWSPLGSNVLADFFPLFELRLAHARYLPDESHPPLCAPVYPFSGVDSGPNPFAGNLLVDPRGAQRVVHSRGLGYRVRPSDLTLTPGGTPLMPFPWNRSGGPRTSYTWRDTAILARNGLRGSGIPLDVEVGSPLFLEQGVGSLAPPGQVPSFALPLLWEVRCFPSTGSIGLNSLDILLPIPGWSTPNFRAFATGGIDVGGHAVTIDPDQQLVPSGGFNPNSNPPGKPTPLSADNSFYVGQIDTVISVSRAVTIWIDSGNFGPRYVEPVVEPATQIGSSSIEIEYRGADSFSSDSGNAPFDAARLDPYGDYRPGTVQYHGDGSWSPDITSANGSRYLQVRFSFRNDIENALSPELDSFGLAFEE